MPNTRVHGLRPLVEFADSVGAASRRVLLTWSAMDLRFPTPPPAKRIDRTHRPNASVVSPVDSPVVPVDVRRGRCEAGVDATRE